MLVIYADDLSSTCRCHFAYVVAICKCKARSLGKSIVQAVLSTSEGDLTAQEPPTTPIPGRGASAVHIQVECGFLANSDLTANVAERDRQIDNDVRNLLRPEKGRQ